MPTFFLRLPAAGAQSVAGPFENLLLIRSCSFLRQSRTHTPSTQRHTLFAEVTIVCKAGRRCTKLT